MLWVDGVIAVPTIGLQLEPYLGTATDFAERIRPILAEALRRGAEIKTEGGLFGVNFELTNGYTIKLDHNNVVVEFGYPVQIHHERGGFAAFKYPISTTPFTTLLEGVVDMIVEVLQRLDQPNRKLHRFGLVATCGLDPAALPPGVAKFVEHVGSPWERRKTKVKVDVTAYLTESGDVRDRCHHKYSMDEDGENPTQLQLDWQRLWGKLAAPETLLSLPRGRDKLVSAVQEHARAAVEYFELFGMGGLKYGGE